ncbi:hypothetical protein PSP6_10131 [Paraburkholderia tropica]|nr:hypothetical protein PSP6_10131 [Paraburkholderia tropica]
MDRAVRLMLHLRSAAILGLRSRLCGVSARRGLQKGLGAAVSYALSMPFSQPLEEMHEHRRISVNGSEFAAFDAG